MTHRSTTSFLFLVILLSATIDGLGQQNALGNLVDKLHAYRSNTLQEKLFIHTDQSFYLTGETLWFKAYYMDASLFRPLAVSKVAYVEILDQDKKAVIQQKIALKPGGGDGSIFLPASLTSGNYVLRVYTNWMKNFDPETYFHKTITIINPFMKLGLKPVKENIQYDVQFFPEGGSLVNGLVSKIAFRIVDQHGKEFPFNGSIVTENGDTLVRFKALKFGLGNFIFKPSGNHQYTAVLKHRDGRHTIHKLPVVNPEGYVMHVDDTTTDKIRIRLNIQSSSVQNPSVYFLAHSRGVPGIAKIGYLYNGKAEFIVDKKDLREGISHFTVFNDQLQPVTERLYYKQPSGKLQLEIRADQSQYATRRRVVLNLNALSPDGPIKSNLSVAVYKMDSTQQEYTDIKDYLLLTSELRGTVTSPEYYTSPGDDEIKRQAIDNLMLTHGWSKTPWENIFANNMHYTFAPEMGGHFIKGQVTDQISDLPANQVVTYLSAPGKTIDLYVSRSDERGEIQFEAKNLYGSKELILQTNTQRDSTYRLKIYSPFSDRFAGYTVSAFDLSTNFKNEILQRSIHMQVQNTFYHDQNNRFIMPPVDSVPFYGVAYERYRLDDYTRFPTMEEVMREYVPGVMVRIHRGKFRFKTLDDVNKTVFNDDPLVLLDGVPVFDINKIMAFDPRKIKKLDVITARYYLGARSFDGLVSYKTYGGDLANFEPDPKSLVIAYDGLQPRREFFSPRYETQQSRETKLPDARTLLYWHPNASTDAAGKGQLDFYTSDVPGKYMVVVQGMTERGEPVSSSTVIDVKDTSNY